jgi:hypothetical protein
MATKTELPVVAPRNDPAPLEPYGKSQALQIQNARPGFVQQWVRQDEVSRYTRRQEIGSPATGYLMVEPWTVVDMTSGYEQGRKRDDASAGVDTVMTNGEMILVETTVENHAKYAVIENKRDAMIDKRLAHGEKNQSNGVTASRRTVGGRDGLSAKLSDVYQGA